MILYLPGERLRRLYRPNRWIGYKEKEGYSNGIYVQGQRGCQVK